MIRNIVFDIGNVLLGFDRMRYLRSLFDEETALRVAKAVFESGHWPQLDIAILSEEEILELFYSCAPDLRSEIKEAFDRIGECVERLDWPSPLIDSLKEKGYKVYFLSNMSEHVKASNTAAFDFVPHMDGGIWSCDVHTIKPGVEIYRILFERYGLIPEECLFIDDHAENIDAGKELGMKGIVYKNHEQLIVDLQFVLKDYM